MSLCPILSLAIPSVCLRLFFSTVYSSVPSLVFQFQLCCCLYSQYSIFSERFWNELVLSNVVDPFHDTDNIFWLMQPTLFSTRCKYDTSNISGVTIFPSHINISRLLAISHIQQIYSRYPWVEKKCGKRRNCSLLPSKVIYGRCINILIRVKKLNCHVRKMVKHFCYVIINSTKPSKSNYFWDVFKSLYSRRHLKTLSFSHNYCKWSSKIEYLHFMLSLIQLIFLTWAAYTISEQCVKRINEEQWSNSSLDTMF